MKQQRLSAKFGHSSHGSSTRIPSAAYANMGHARNNTNDKGYNSDGSDDSVSMISQSYGAYLFDANYKTRMQSTSFRARTGGLQLCFFFCLFFLSYWIIIIIIT